MLIFELTHRPSIFCNKLNMLLVKRQLHHYIAYKLNLLYNSCIALNYKTECYNWVFCKSSIVREFLSSVATASVD